MDAYSEFIDSLDELIVATFWKAILETVSFLLVVMLLYRLMN
jgi:hypothetical protein